jgi:hypothetical protein
MPNGSAGAGVARAVTQAMAARAGLPPLASARAGGVVAGGLRGSSGAVTLELAAGTGSLQVWLSAVDDGALGRMAEQLVDHGVERDGGALVLRFERPPLHGVAD